MRACVRFLRQANAPVKMHHRGEGGSSPPVQYTKESEGIETEQNLGEIVTPPTKIIHSSIFPLFTTEFVGNGLLTGRRHLLILRVSRFFITDECLSFLFFFPYKNIDTSIVYILHEIIPHFTPAVYRP